MQHFPKTLLFSHHGLGVGLEVGTFDKDFWALSCMVPKNLPALYWTGLEIWLIRMCFFGVFFGGELDTNPKHPVLVFSMKILVSMILFERWDKFTSNWHILGCRSCPQRHCGEPGSTNKDSLYLMTTALKGSALILTWACTLAWNQICGWPRGWLGWYGCNCVCQSL